MMIKMRKIKLVLDGNRILYHLRSYVHMHSTNTTSNNNKITKHEIFTRYKEEIALGNVVI